MFLKTFILHIFFWRTPEFSGKFTKFWSEDHFSIVSLVLIFGLEHFGPWPRDGLPSVGLSLALASDFFCVLGLGLEPCVVGSTSGIYGDIVPWPPSLGHGKIALYCIVLY